MCFKSVDPRSAESAQCKRQSYNQPERPPLSLLCGVFYIFAAFNDCTSPPAIPNSIVKWVKSQPTGSDTFTSGKVWVQCDKGYVYEGPLPLVCAGNGKWSSEDNLRKSFRITLSVKKAD